MQHKAVFDLRDHFLTLKILAAVCVAVQHGVGVAAHSGSRAILAHRTVNGGLHRIGRVSEVCGMLFLYEVCMNPVQKSAILFSRSPSPSNRRPGAESIGAQDILSDMKKKRTDPLIIMGEVSRTVCDQISVFALISDGLTHKEIAKILGIHEYKVSLIAKAGRINDERRLLDLCKKADIDIKSFSDGYTVLEKLICTM